MQSSDCCRRSVMLVMSVALLSACSLFGPRPDLAANQPPPGILLRFRNDIKEVQSTAEDYCRRHGKSAKLDKVTPSGDDKIAYYDCV